MSAFLALISCRIICNSTKPLASVFCFSLDDDDTSVLASVYSCVVVGWLVDGKLSYVVCSDILSAHYAKGLVILIREPLQQWIKDFEKLK